MVTTNQTHIYDWVVASRQAGRGTTGDALTFPSYED
jgi:hypothetical protein